MGVRWKRGSRRLRPGSRSVSLRPNCPCVKTRFFKDSTSFWRNPTGLRPAGRVLSPRCARSFERSPLTCSRRALPSSFRGAPRALLTACGTSSPGPTHTRKRRGSRTARGTAPRGERPLRRSHPHAFLPLRSAAFRLHRGRVLPGRSRRATPPPPCPPGPASRYSGTLHGCPRGGLPAGGRVSRSPKGAAKLSMPEDEGWRGLGAWACSGDLNRAVPPVNLRNITAKVRLGSTGGVPGTDMSAPSNRFVTRGGGGENGAKGLGYVLHHGSAPLSWTLVERSTSCFPCIVDLLLFPRGSAPAGRRASGTVELPAPGGSLIQP